MKKVVNLILFIIPFFVSGQYHFEKFKSPKYESFSFKIIKNDDILEGSILLKLFFNDKTDLQIKLKENFENQIGSYFQIKSKLKSKIYFEETSILGVDSLFIADFNGDGKKDLKILCPTMGSGLASLNVRVIYFFQTENKNFTKVSFYDKMETNRFERDLDNDGNYEIITMSLQAHENHNYWIFNVYRFVNENLLCINDKFNYPFMVQLLYRDNFEITKKFKQGKTKGLKNRRNQSGLYE